jgi:hypothetical protein
VGHATRTATGKHPGQLKAGTPSSFAALMLQADELPDAPLERSGNTTNAKKKSDDTEVTASGADAVVPPEAAPYPLMDFMQRSAKIHTEKAQPATDSIATQTTQTTQTTLHNPHRNGDSTPGVSLNTATQALPSPPTDDPARSKTTADARPSVDSLVIHDDQPSRPPSADIAVALSGNNAPPDGSRLMSMVGKGETNPSVPLNNTKEPSNGPRAEDRPSDAPAATSTPAGVGKVRLQGWRAGAALSGHVSTVKLASAPSQQAGSAAALNPAVTQPLTTNLQQVGAAALTPGRANNEATTSVRAEAESAAVGAIPPAQEASASPDSSDQQPGGHPSGHGFVDAQVQQPSSAPSDLQAAGNAAPFSDLMNQLSDQVNTLVNQGVQTATLTVDGDGANPVNVQVTMDDGEVSVTFGAIDPSTLDALKSQAEATLKPMLETQGMTLNQVSVEAQASMGTLGGSGGQTGSGHTNDQRPSSGSSVSKATASTAAPPRTTPRSPQAPKGHLDLFA